MEALMRLSQQDRPPIVRRHANRAHVRHATERPPGHSTRTIRRLDRTIAGLLVFVFIGGLGVLAALVPVGHGFVPKGGGWFKPEVVGGAFTLYPLFIAVPSAACFVLGLLDWRRPWRAGHLDLLALAGFFPVAMLLSDDLSPAGLWLAAVCLGWLFARMLGAAFGAWRMPELRPSISSRWLGRAILILLLVRIGSVAAGNISDVGQASSLGAWRLLHGLHLYGAVSWPGPGGLRIYRPDSYGPFAYYAYLPFAVIFPPAPAQLATLLPAVCFDALTLAGLHTLGRRLGGRPLAQAFVFAYLLYPFPDLSLMAQTNDALIAALCVWAIVAATERPAARGLLLAAAALTKFLPALLALQFLGVRKGRTRYALTLAASLAAMLAWPLITSGPAQFLDSTLGYQLIQRGGGVQFSIWTYMPHAAIVARPVLAAALVLLALSPMLRHPVQDPRQHAALAAALLIGAQLLLGYWFYSYLTWCYPLLIIAIIHARSDRETASTSAHGAASARHDQSRIPVPLAADSRARRRRADHPGHVALPARRGLPVVREAGPAESPADRHPVHRAVAGAVRAAGPAEPAAGHRRLAGADPAGRYPPRVRPAGTPGIRRGPVHDTRHTPDPTF
jgi:Glycosyltransferase family 87